MQTEIVKTSVSQMIKLTIFFMVILLLVSISLIATNAAMTLKDTIYEGVDIGDISVGGLTQEEAHDKILSFWSIRSAEPLRLVYGDKEWSFTADEIELSIAYNELIHQAYQVGRTGNVYNQLKERYITVNQGYVIPLQISVNRNKLNKIVTDIRKNIDKEPQNAGLVVKGQHITLVPDSIGKKVNIDKTLRDIETVVNSQAKSIVNLTVDDQIPTIKSSELLGIDRIFSSYTTQFSFADSNRADNIILAAKSVNNILLRRGEIFSFNQHVGLRLKERGYKMAPGYIDGVLVPDWGGGVCQVSSTIYNAALLANMTIDERTSHFSPPAYVPLGLDATVADHYLDFRFRNTTSGNIFIKTEIDGNVLTVTILGNKDEILPEIELISTDKKVIEPKTIMKEDNKLELGKQVVEVEGEKGFIVTVYRIKRVNGKEITREFVSYDEFKPVDTVVRLGTKPPEKLPEKQIKSKLP